METDKKTAKKKKHRNVHMRTCFGCKLNLTVILEAYPERIYSFLSLLIFMNVRPFSDSNFLKQKISATEKRSVYFETVSIYSLDDKNLAKY